MPRPLLLGLSLVVAAPACHPVMPPAESQEHVAPTAEARPPGAPPVAGPNIGGEMDSDAPRSALRPSDKDKGDKAASTALASTAGEQRERPGLDGKRAQAEQPHPHDLVRCFPGDAAGEVRPLDALLQRTLDRFDDGEFEGALACAEEAARIEPRSVEAHTDRAAALQELGRLDEAESAVTRALAIDPDDADALAAAADLYINHLAPSNDHSETGLEYARRGAHRAKATRDKALGARLALLEGQALDDLGRPREALARLDAAAVAAPSDLRVRYERAVALFELSRFHEAKLAFESVIAADGSDAWAHHHLGLVLERLGDGAAADRELAKARALAPRDFPSAPMPTASEFRKMVDDEVAKLPATLRADLGRVQLETADVPDVTDLTAEEPPLSPTILGLFRGVPIDQPLAPGDARTIVLYRKNLARAVVSRDELVTQVRTTLLHELGHLRGEDDEELRACGLE